MPDPHTPAARGVLDAKARRALGLAARKQLARSAHAKAAHKSARKPADALDLLRTSEQGRIPALLALKHQRMAANAFGFYRGAVPIMAADLAAQPNTGLITQLCGDAHISNLGAFAAGAASLSGGPDGHLAFDIDDFDETIRGPFEFDLKRLATSLILGGRVAGIKLAARERAVLQFAAQYRRRMHRFADMPIVDLARYQIHRLAHTAPMPAIFAQAQRATPAKTLNSLTEPAEATASTRQFKTDTLTPHLLQRITGKEAALVLAALGPYARTLQPERRHFLNQYRPIDVAFKVVGTGSVGLRDYVVYLEGTHAAPKKGSRFDPLFLQIKEEPASSYAPYLPEGSQHTHEGHRAMDGQRAMQLTSDPFLGYTTVRDENGRGRDYLVRQLNDHKASLDLTTLTAGTLCGYADLCGELFARGHARSGDPVAIAAYLGTSDRFDKALLGFAHAYADRTETYYAAFKDSLKTVTNPKPKSKRKSS